MTHPLVSVIIPTYQRAHTLERAISSALEQSYPMIEVVVSDNASSDDTGRVLSSYSNIERLRVVRHERNIGPVANWRTALDAASGELVKVNWSDDWMEPHVVGDLVGAILSRDGLGFAIANQTIHLPSGTIETRRTAGPVGVEDVVGSVLLGLGLPVSPGAGLVWREDADWALSSARGVLDAQCVDKAIGPDLLMLYGALRRSRVGIHAGTSGVHFDGGADSITLTENRGVLRSCYVNALIALVESTGDRRALAMVHQLLVLRRIRDIWRPEGSEPSNGASLVEALNPWALPLVVRQLFLRLSRRL